MNIQLLLHVTFWSSFIGLADIYAEDVMIMNLRYLAILSFDDTMNKLDIDIIRKGKYRGVS